MKPFDKYFILLVSAMLAFTRPAVATNYYLSNSGNDSFPGTRPDSAWQSLNKLNTVILQPGDSVLFNKGDIFRGQINLQGSGSNGNYIYFGGYGNGNANPVISGCVVASNWKVFNGNIYADSIEEPVNNVFVNKKIMTSAREPNAGFRTIALGGSAHGFGDPHLNPAIDSAGSRVVIRSSDVKYVAATIESVAAGWLEFTTALSNPPASGYGYYIDHDSSALDAPKEWYYSSATRRLYFYAPDSANPNSLNVEASVFDYGIYDMASVSDIVFNGLDFDNQAKDGVMLGDSSSNVYFTNSNFSGCYLRAINLNTAINDSINHCTFNNITGDCITIQNAQQNIFSYNQIKNTGTIPGYGLDGITDYNAIGLNRGPGNIITNNRIDSTGGSAIIFSGKNNLIDKNLITNSIITLNSEGAIVTSNNDTSLSVISNDFIFNTKGNNTATPNSLFAYGIDLENSSNISILHNTVVNSQTYGIFVNENNHNHAIQNNVVYNSGAAQMYFVDPDNLNGTHDNKTLGNIFYCLNDRQYPLSLQGYNQSFHPGQLDSNYYCNPYSYFPIHRRYFDGNEYFDIVYSIPQWASQFGDNLSSKTSLVKWEAFKTEAVTGQDLVPNGDFTNNFDNWLNIPSTNNELLLDNDTGLDGGCGKFIMLHDTPSIWGELQCGEFSGYAKNQVYQLSFSAKSINNVNLLTFAESGIAGNLFNLGFSKFYPISNSRSDFYTTFESDTSCPSSRVIFELTYPDSLLWIDNVHLYPVSASHNDSSKYSRLITNYSPSSINVSLGDSVFNDLNGNKVGGSYLLPPYSSYVLTIDSSSFLSSGKSITIDNNLVLFPNPLNPLFQQLHYSLTSFEDNEIQFQLIDLFGRIIISKILHNKSGEILIPQGTPAGFYIARVSGNKSTFEKKLSIIH